MTNYEAQSKAFMKALDEYAESRHINGSADYNPKTQEARLKVRAIAEQLLLSHDTLCALVPSAPKVVDGLKDYL